MKRGTILKADNLIGYKFGKLTVIKRGENSKTGNGWTDSEILMPTSLNNKNIRSGKYE